MLCDKLQFTDVLQKEQVFRDSFILLMADMGITPGNALMIYSTLCSKFMSELNIMDTIDDIKDTMIALWKQLGEQYRFNFVDGQKYLWWLCESWLWDCRYNLYGGQ
jgi:hypothetical protein